MAKDRPAFPNCSPPCGDFHPQLSVRILHPPQRTREGSHHPLPNPPKTLRVLQAAAPKAPLLLRLVPAAEAGSAIRLIGKGTGSREQLLAASVLVRHLLLLIWGLIKANAVMVTLLLNRLFLCWLGREKGKQ